MSNSIACICNDSMAIHMASALGSLILVFFARQYLSSWVCPWKIHLDGRFSNLPCRPCGRHGRSTCPTGTEACMKDLHRSCFLRI
ncbi:MAG: hypothetical protein R3A13_11150 [Bdellovibrionota bacterium]